MSHNVGLHDATSAADAVSAATVLRPVEPPAVGPGAVLEAVDFGEAVYQTQPLVKGAGRVALRAAEFLTQSTARTHGLRAETAYRLVTSEQDLLSFVSGPHPTGKAAEIVVACDFRQLHAESDPGMLNSPVRIAGNVRDVRLSPDAASRRDLIFLVRAGNGLLAVGGGQVKTGSGRYVSESLVKMAQTPGYGRTGYVDARYVKPDGSPRVAPDAFTVGQARRLREAGVELRGIRDLDERSHRLVRNIVAHARDGLDPIAREELLSLREEIAAVYAGSQVASRVVGAAASAAATSTVVSLVVKYASSGSIDLAEASSVAAKAALRGAGSAAADAALYHAATRMGLAPEAAQAFARRVVANGLCLVAIASDVIAEVKAVREGRISVAEALSGGAFKTVLNVLPMLMPPLGLVGVPLVAAFQVGGRWAIAAVRSRDSELAREIAEDRATADMIRLRTARLGDMISSLSQDCEGTDRLFEQVMAPTVSGGLRLVK